MDMDNIQYTLTFQDRIDKTSIIPAYYQLAKILEYKIRLAEFKQGDKLPTEVELAEKYQISRMTVRRAIAELVNKKLVTPQKGRGTFINKPNIDNIVFELEGFLEDLEKRGLQTIFKLIEAKAMRSNGEDRISKKLLLSKGERYLYTRSILYADEEPLMYDVKYLHYYKQKPILEVSSPSLYHFIRDNTDKMPTKSDRVLKVALLTNEEALLLNVPPNTPAFLLEQLFFDENDLPIGLSKSLYRGDRYKLTSTGKLLF